MASQHTTDDLLKLCAALQPGRPALPARRLKGLKRHDRAAYKAMCAGLASLSWRVSKQTPVCQTYYVDGQGEARGLWEHPHIMLTGRAALWAELDAAAPPTADQTREQRLYALWRRDADWLQVVAQPTSQAMHLPAVLWRDDATQSLRQLGGGEALRQWMGQSCIGMADRMRTVKEMAEKLEKRTVAVRDALRLVLDVAHCLWGEPTATMDVEQPKKKTKHNKSKKTRKTAALPVEAPLIAEQPVMAVEPPVEPALDANVDEPAAAAEEEEEEAPSMDDAPLYETTVHFLSQSPRRDESDDEPAPPRRPATVDVLPAHNDADEYAKRAQWLCSVTGMPAYNMYVPQSVLGAHALAV